APPWSARRASRSTSPTTRSSPRMRCRPSSGRAFGAVSMIVPLVVASLVLGVLGAAQADQKSRKRKVDRRVAQLRGDLEDTSQRVEAAIRALHRAESRLPAAQARVASVRGRLAAAQARDAMLADRLQVAEAKLARAEKRIARTV